MDNLHVDLTPATGRRDVVAMDPNVRVVKPPWDKKVPALTRLFEDQMDTERRRPYLKAAATSKVAQLERDASSRQRQQHGPGLGPTALLDSVIAIVEQLRGHQEKAGIALPSDEAEYIPLVFENLVKLCDHAKRSTVVPKNEIVEAMDKESKEVEGLRKTLQDRDKQNSLQSQEMAGLRKERDDLLEERHSLQDQIDKAYADRTTLLEEKHGYMQLWEDEKAQRLFLPTVGAHVEAGQVTTFARRNALICEPKDPIGKEEHEELRASRDRYRKWYNDECDNMERLRKQRENLKSRVSHLESELSNAQEEVVDRTELSDMSSRARCETMEELYNLKKQLNGANSQCTKLEQEIKRLKVVNEDKQLAIDREVLELKHRYKRELSKMKATTAQGQQEMQNQINELTEASSAMSTELEGLKEKLDSAYATQKELRKQHAAELQRAVSDMESACNTKHNVQMEQRERVKVTISFHCSYSLLTLDFLQRVELHNLSKTHKDEKVQLQKSAVHDQQSRLTEQRKQLTKTHDRERSQMKSSLLDKLKAQQQSNTESIAEYEKKAQSMQHEIERSAQMSHHQAVECSNLRAAATKSNEEHMITLNSLRQSVREMELASTEDQTLIITFFTSLVEARAAIANSKFHLAGRGAILMEAIDSDRKKGQAIEELQRELRKARSDAEELYTSVTSKVDTLSEEINAKDTMKKTLASDLAICEAERQFHLGRLNRATLFDAFADHARQLFESRSFSGGMSGQPVNVCICVLSDLEEILLLVRRCSDDAYMVWQGRAQDFTTFTHDWRFWIRVQKGMHGQPLYVSVDSWDEVNSWLAPVLQTWTLSKEEEELLMESHFRPVEG